jgi:hypothetical protein
MNLFNFIQTGGFPMDVDVLDQMQTAYNLYNGLGALAGDIAIIKGCVLSGSTVSDGVVYINGEVLDFRSGVVAPNVIIIQESQSKEFENGSVNEVHYTRYATFGVATTSYPWTSFKRAFPTTLIVEALALKAEKSVVDTLLNRMAAAETKLATIATGAEVNVQSDMGVTDANSDAYVKNKPNIVDAFLHKGFVTIGDPDGKITRTITIPNLGTSNYVVLGCLEGRNGNRSIDIGSVWNVFSRTSTSFVLGISDVGGVQALDFSYVIVAR